MILASRVRAALTPLVLLSLAGSCAASDLSAAPPRPARAARSQPVRYTVSIPRPEDQYVHVTMAIPAASGKTVDVAMPAWTPGSYKIRDFGRHVYDLRAEDMAGNPLEVTRLDKQTWRVAHNRGGFRLHYRVFADDASVRTSEVRDRHAHLLGSSVFLYLRDDTQRRATVEVQPPPGWPVHTALPSSGPNVFHARDYDHLVDSPIQLGASQVRKFTVDGKALEYVFTAPNGSNADVGRLAQDAEKIVGAFGRMMQGLPFDRYLFLVRATPRGGGGLEHHDSTSMMVRQDAFDSPRAYQRAAHLAAHEFFHLWNVKRIHDQVLGPFDYARENYTRLLWFHEGFTETMEAQATLRAGLDNPNRYLTNLAKTYNAYLRAPGRDRIPVSQFSFEAWIEQYQPARNAPNVAVSYYRKGDLVGVCLDLEIRLRSARHDGSGSLAGVFRRLMESHGSTGRGITADDIESAATAEAGEDMGWFFDRFVDGTQPLPILSLLDQVGVDTIEDPQESAPYTGLQLSGARVRNVRPDSPATAAGIMRGDEILAVGDRRVGDDDAESRLAAGAAGEPVRLLVDRQRRILELTLEPGPSPDKTFVFQLRSTKKLDPAVLAVRDSWLEVYAK